MICSVLLNVDALQNWSRKWLLNLNIKKCLIVSFGIHVNKALTYKICDSSSHMIPLEKGNKVLDLGVRVALDEKLSISEHIQTKLITHT